MTQNRQREALVMFERTFDREKREFATEWKQLFPEERKRHIAVLTEHAMKTVALREKI